MRPNQPVTDARSQAMSANTVTKPTYFSGTRPPLLRKKLKTHGEKDQSLTNGRSVVAAVANDHLQVIVHRRQDNIAILPSVEANTRQLTSASPIQTFPMGLRLSQSSTASPLRRS